MHLERSEGREEGGEDEGWTDIHGTPLATYEMDSKTAKSFRETAARMGVPVHGRADTAAHVINRHYEGAPFLPNFAHVRVVYLDIETDMEKDNKEILSIAARVGGKTYAWGMRYYAEAGIYYKKCRDEAHMMEAFLEWWAADYPQIVAHINGDAFDIKIIVERIKTLLGRQAVKKLSPWGLVRPAKVLASTRRKVDGYDIVGVVSLDWAILYWKFVDQFAKEKAESFSLEAIAQTTLGRGKLPFEGDLTQLYREDFDTFIEYNAHDCQLIEDLEGKLHLIELVFNMAMDSKSNLLDCIKTVKMWDNIIANDLATRKIAVPHKQDDTYDEDAIQEIIKGGWVLEPVVGRHRWVAAFDYINLYPSIMETFNISPETKMGMGAHIEGCSFSALGVNFRQDKQGFIPRIITQHKMRRAAIRHRMTELEEGTAEWESLQTEQNGIKVKIAALYGALLNKWFRWYDPELGESITLTGQSLTKGIVEALGAAGLQVVASDTDSAFIVLGPYMDDRGIEPSLENAQEICERIVNPLIHETIERVIREHFVTGEVTLKMEADLVADVAIWAGKKNYILSLVSSKGKAKRETMIKGLRARKRTTPKMHRDAILDMVEKYIIHSDDHEALLAAVEAHMEHCRRIGPWYLAQNMILHNRPDRYIDGDTDTGWKKGTPQHYKAAIAYNRYVDDLNLRAPHIAEMDSVLLYHLKNGQHPFSADVVANVHILLPEHMLRDIFDYEKVLDKNFKDPLRQIVNAIGRDI